MPTYIHNGSAWVEIASVSTSTGPNVYIRTSGSGTVDQNRVVEIYGHDGGTWQKVYQAFVPVLPAKPAKPTLSRASGWNTRIDTTKVSWGAISGATGYALEIYDGNYSLVDYRTYTSATTNSGNIAITPNGNIYYFRLYAYATNEAGTIYSDASTDLRIVSGSQNVNFTLTNSGTWYFTKSANGASSCRVGNTYSISKTGSSADSMVSGYVFIEDFGYTIDDYGGYSLASGTRFIRETGTNLGGYDYNTANGYGNYTDPVSAYRVVNAAGGGTWRLQAQGDGWFSTGTNCGIPTLTAIAYGMFINGYETTYNTA